MSAPDKYVDMARDIFEDPFFRPFRNDHCINEVATALREAEAEGMRRAAEIAQAKADRLRRNGLYPAYGLNSQVEALESAAVIILSQAGGE